jgi:hypothetical protein
LAYIPTKPKSIGKSGKYKSSASLGGGAKIKSSWGSSGAGVIPEFDIEGKPTGRFGFAGSGVTAVYSGKKSDKSSDSLITGTFTGAEGTTTKSYSLSSRVIPSDVNTGRSDYNPRRDAFFNATNRVNPVSDSGIVYNPSYRVRVSPNLYNKYVREAYGRDDSPMINSGGVMDEGYVNPYTNVSGRFIPFASGGDTAYMDSEKYQLREEYGGNPYPYRAGIILADVSESIKSSGKNNGLSYFDEAKSIDVFGGGVSEFPSRVYNKALLNFKGTKATPIFSSSDKSAFTIGKAGDVVGGFAGDVLAGYSRFFGFAGSRRGVNVGVGSDSSLFGTFPKLKGKFEGFTKDFFNYDEAGARGYFVSDANSWGGILGDKKVGTAGLVTGLGLLSVVSPVASVGIKWGMAGYGGLSAYTGYKTNNPEAFFGGSTMLFLSKPFERALYNPVSVKGSEFFGFTTKPENLNMNFVEDFTIPRSLRELRGFEGKSASTIHTADANPYGLFGKSFDVVKTEGRAEGWRARLDLFGIYKSSPEIVGFDVGKGFYGEGLGKSNAWVYNRVEPSLWGDKGVVSMAQGNSFIRDFSYVNSKPNAYLAYAIDFGDYTEMPKSVRFGKGVVNVLDFRNDFISSNVGGNNLKGVVEAQKYYGGTYVPSQNVFGMSGEGQFVSPVGTRISKTGEPVTYSFYRQSNPYISDTSFFGRVKGVAWDVGATITGSKYSLLRVIPSKTIPVIDVFGDGTKGVNAIDRLGGRSSGGVVSLSYPSTFSLPTGFGSSSSFRSFSVPTGISGYGSSSRVSSGYGSVSSLSSYSSFMSSSGLSGGGSSGSSRSSGLSSSIIGSDYSSSGGSSGLSSAMSSTGLSSGGSSTTNSYFPTGLGGFGSKGKDLLSPMSFNPEYVGSVMAGDRRLFGRKPSRVSVSSGLAVRPLLRIRSGRMKF